MFKNINQARQGSSQGENGGKRVHMYVYKVSASNTNAYGYSVKHSRRAHTCTHLPRSGISDLAVCSTSFSRFRLSDRDRRRPGHGRRACRVERDATERHRTESKHKQTRDNMERDVIVSANQREAHVNSKHTCSFLQTWRFVLSRSSSRSTRLDLERRGSSSISSEFRSSRAPLSIHQS